MAPQRRHTRRWPAAIDHDGHDYLSTAQVAKVLGIKRESVYAYVSRGRLHSVRIAGVRGSVFAVAEVEALAGAGVRARPPAGVVERIRTQLTSLSGDELCYRGVPARELVDRDFLDVARLLWGHEVPAQQSPLDEGATAHLRAALPHTAGLLDVVRIAVDLAGASDPLRHQRTGSVVATKGMQILEAVSSALPTVRGDITTGSYAKRLWPKLSPLSPTRDRVGVLNAALVLLADHDLAASTVAARVAASARAGVYSVVAAGLAALDGPMHGGAATAAYRYLHAALADPVAAVASSLRSGERIPGTGHRIYREHDPRALDLLDLLARAGGGTRVRTAVETIASAGDFVNSDLALAAMALQFRMPADAPEAVFGIARIVGWVAHALEEYDEPMLRFRPEGVYVGKRSN
ncbi:citrate synthase-like protein [Mycolicibacterium canariasense]|uniref:citrate synthase (unknown stereospecificity) n=1 Tax=Mycolicibacterium canariasense TaxID=228230 RepID=A0A117IC70_MYCCR|nr:citrate synthase [Mycolicibacterium canariasense]MCV7208192.1 helix-turn-helix domain-containing protein [Mycolicibacterium canariasense]ORV09469.1 citrate synthase [Mycolicibacterium canariasense]GAS99064.1 citrate synthase-like protein [Mycolicibacterium canariasense]